MGDCTKLPAENVCEGTTLLKMIITCRRNPTMSRPEFFHHLRNVHWPLIQRHPDVLARLPGYVQNHSVLPEKDLQLLAPFEIALERDSVIELKFDGIAGIDRLLSTPSYMQYIRPDEARFNDLPHNIMVLTEASLIFQASSVGRCKRFDFIRRASRTTAPAFHAVVKQQSQSLAIDPLYTAHVDRHTDNVVATTGLDGGFGDGAFDLVREVWGTSFAALSAVASRSALDCADPERSFSVFATEIPIYGTVD